MYVDTSTIKQKGKSYTRHLLRESYREEGKVKRRTIANLGRCTPAEIEAIRLALRHKDDLTRIVPVKESVVTRQGLSIGAVWVVYEVSRQLGIVDALGKSREGKLALWQVIARVNDQGSRLSAVRFGGGGVTFVGDRGMIKNRQIEGLLKDDEALMEIARLDGCYVLKTESMNYRVCVWKKSRFME